LILNIIIIYYTYIKNILKYITKFKSNNKMGVKGLFQFLKRFEKEVNVPQYLYKKSVGVDIFWFLHKSKGDMFVLQSFMTPIIRNAKEVHCVFDGH